MHVRTKRKVVGEKNLSRKTKLFLNMGSSILYQILAVVSGMILPRFFMMYFGSEANGLVNSISQFLSYIALMDMGVGAVFQSALYKPLAQKDHCQINNVFCAGKIFYNKIGILILIYIAVLAGLYPFIVSDLFDYSFTFILILAMSINTFAQYFMGLTYQIFLTADQKHYVQSSINSGTLIINTIVSIILIKLGCSIQIVKLSTSCIFLLRPLLLKIYVDRNYRIDYSVKPTKDAIPQKWNGFSQHIAAVVLNNTDVAVLTFFSTLKNVSIYSVYYMVVSAVKQMISLIVGAVSPTLGNYYGLGKKEQLEDFFELLEWFTHFITSYLFVITGILIVPFVNVYTKGITDANYEVPLFSVLIAMATAMTSYQQPYKILVQVVGHYKQTQLSSIIEAVINIFISIVMVFQYGLIGVAIGTLAAMLYRLIYLMRYIQKNVYYRKSGAYIKLILVDILCIGGTILATIWFDRSVSTYFSWFCLAIVVCVVAFIVFVIINYIMYRNMFEKMLSGIALDRLTHLRKKK